MGWLVKTKEENGEKKYRIWTTVSDGWITDWSTKEEINKFFFWHRFYEFAKKFLEDAMTFPHQYCDKDTREMFICEKEANDFYDFQLKALRGKDYEKNLLSKFTEVINASGFDVKVEDIRGFGFDSKEEKKKDKEDFSDVITNDPKFLLGVLRNIESNMSKSERKSKSNVAIVRDYLMCHTSKGGRTSSYEMCEYLGIDGDAYTFNKKDNA